MASTIKYDLTDSAWTEVSDGLTNVAVQLLTTGKVLVHLGDSAPAGSAVGIAIGDLAGIPRTFSASNLPPSTGVYLRSGGKPLAVVVLTY